MRIHRYLALGLPTLVLALSFTGHARAADKDDDDEKEVKVKLTDCPAAVQATINAQAAGAPVTKVEMVTPKSGPAFYEAKVKPANGKKREIVVAADGTLKPAAAEKDEAGEKK